MIREVASSLGPVPWQGGARWPCAAISPMPIAADAGSLWNESRPAEDMMTHLTLVWRLVLCLKDGRMEQCPSECPCGARWRHQQWMTGISPLLCMVQNGRNAAEGGDDRRHGCVTCIFLAAWAGCGVAWSSPALSFAKKPRRRRGRQPPA